ncbi:NUDIX hydrolase domain-like protein, partial [Immersiella caudata]
LAPFSVNPDTYLKSNPTISRLLVSAVVIRSPDQNPHALLVQRAASDGFPLQWECPGGSVDSSDVTILHALQREIFEETGLGIKQVTALLDGSVEFQWGKGICRKLTFLVSVGDEVPEVVLNEEEHVDHVWAAEEGVERGVCDGKEIKFAY